MSKYLLFFAVLFWSCSGDISPKPFGHIKIDLPAEHTLKETNIDCPFSIKISENSELLPKSQPCWFDIYYPQHKAVIHLTYQPIQGNLAQLVEDSRSLVMGHSNRADGLDESIYINDSLKVYGTFYELLGNTANYLQFYLTDSTDNYLRGALYFNVAPNRDSLQPVISWMKEDMREIIQSVRWD